MKNRIKGSMWAKVVAWFILLVNVIIFGGSAIAAVVMENYGIFSKNYTEVQSEVRNNVYGNYAAQAMANFLKADSSKNEAIFEDKCYRYGIIKSDDISDSVVNDKNMYKARNFSKNVNFSDLWWEQIDVSDDLNIEYENNGLFGYYSIWNSRPYNTLYASGICYDTKEGKFYYLAEGKYYLARQVSVDVAILSDDIEERTLNFIYDAEKNKYVETEYNAYGLMPNTYEEWAEADIVISESELQSAEETQTYEVCADENAVVLKNNDAVFEIIYNANGLTFNEFDDTSFDFDKWNWICFDGVRFIKANELTLIDSSKMQKKLFQEVSDSYLDENYTLHVEKPSESYYIVAFIDEAVFEEEKAEYIQLLSDKNLFEKIVIFASDSNIDMFVSTEILLDIAYQWKTDIWGVMTVSALAAIIAFGFLIIASGHRSGREEIVTTFIDRVALETLSIVYIVVFFCAMAFISELVYIHPLSLYLRGYLLILMCLMVCVITIVFMLSIAVRIKNHTIWKNSFIYRICKSLKKLCCYVIKHTDIILKTCIVWGVWTIFKVILMIACDDYGVSIFILCMGALAETVVLLLVILQLKKLQTGAMLLAQGKLTEKIDTSRMQWEFKKHGNNLNSIAEGMACAVDERMKSEHLKTELITNVSHDIKTPLTSIINYVDLLEKTQLQDETQKEYLAVLHRQSEKLKKLIEDLIEASKASTGNLPVAMEKLEADVFLTQIIGEFEEKFNDNCLQIVLNKPTETVCVYADGRHLWRVADNLMNNICKYALPNSRVYINLEKTQNEVCIIFRNISKYPLNITGEELMERFVRGDSSRNTDGNGLGLSIAGSLMELMNAKLELYIDGDLFKVILRFKE